MHTVVIPYAPGEAVDPSLFGVPSGTDCKLTLRRINDKHYAQFSWEDAPVQLEEVVLRTEDGWERKVTVRSICRSYTVSFSDRILSFTRSDEETADGLAVFKEA